MTYLKGKTEKVHTVKAEDLNTFIESVYGVAYDYNWVMAYYSVVESGDPTEPDENVFFIDGYVTDFGQQEIDDFLAGTLETLHPETILDYMCKGGLIPKGKYVIES